VQKQEVPKTSFEDLIIIIIIIRRRRRNSAKTRKSSFGDLTVYHL
jgi:hypothetical protein